MKDIGIKLKLQIKDIVLNYIYKHTKDIKENEGLTTSRIFKECGLDWGNQLNSTTSQQQFWLVGLLRELEKENKIIRSENKLWRISS